MAFFSVNSIRFGDSLDDLVLIADENTSSSLFMRWLSTCVRFQKMDIESRQNMFRPDLWCQLLNLLSVVVVVDVGIFFLVITKRKLIISN